MKKIRSWSLAVEWEHSDKTWSTELLGQGDADYKPKLIYLIASATRIIL
jgi:hypothetical protein